MSCSLVSQVIATHDVMHSKLNLLPQALAVRILNRKENIGLASVDESGQLHFGVKM